MLYAVTSVIFIVTYAPKSNVQNLVLPVLSQVVCISPKFIILRVAIGRAVTADTYAHQISQHSSEVSIRLCKLRESRDTGTQLSAVAESEDMLRHWMGSAFNNFSVA